MRRIRVLAEERGEFSLTGLLMAIAIFSGVLGATLTTFQSFTTGRTEVEVRNDAQDRARLAIDRLSRELRNLASPTPDQPEAFDAAGPYDMVFKTVDPAPPPTGSLNTTNTKRVRYCLDTAAASGARLVAQTQTWTGIQAPPAPSTSGCPGNGWTSTQTLATAITNTQAGMDRPIFSFDASVLTDIGAVRANLWVDVDTGGGAQETELSSGVFLRNQNRRPVSAFTATASAQGIVLNGSPSYDPEGEPLLYQWWDGDTKVGSGITFTYSVPAGSEHELLLKVYDPALLEGVSDSQEVVA